MPINITMPALSPTMEEGNLVKWLVKEGDTVAAGDVIAEIETDKATMEVEAVDEGTVARLLVAGGTENVKVNAVIAVLAGEGEDVGEAVAAAPEMRPQSPPQAPEQAPPKAPVEAPKKSSSAEAPQPTAPKTAQPEPPAPLTQKKEAVTDPVDRIFASPLARRIARDEKIELSAINGSGPNGRIIKRDVLAALATGAASAQPGARAVQAAKGAESVTGTGGDDQILKLFEEGTYELKPHDNMRKVIARRLVEAKSTIPHFYLSIDCRLDALLDLRREINAGAPVIDGEPAYKISVNDMIIKALGLALQAVPEANVCWSDSAMVMHKHSDVGVAVSIPDGLITPVVRKAETKTLSVISNEMKDLSARARERKLMPEEYQGGSTVVSNLGMFGIRDFSAIINPPHATLLAVGAGEKRAVIVDGAVTAATMMSITLSTDHRAVDGALGAQLLDAFKHYIEKPMGMLV